MKRSITFPTTFSQGYELEDYERRLTEELWQAAQFVSRLYINPRAILQFLPRGSEGLAQVEHLEASSVAMSEAHSEARRTRRGRALRVRSSPLA